MTVISRDRSDQLFDRSKTNSRVSGGPRDSVDYRVRQARAHENGTTPTNTRCGVSAQCLEDVGAGIQEEGCTLHIEQVRVTG